MRRPDDAPDLEEPELIGTWNEVGPPVVQELGANQRIKRKLAFPKRNRPTMKRTHDFDHPARNPN